MEENPVTPEEAMGEEEWEERPLARNPISFLGGFLTLLGLGSLVFVLSAVAMGTEPNPYTGIFAFLILPGLLTAGLILIPAGMGWEAWRRRRAAQRGEEYPPAFIIDLSSTRHLTGLLAFGAATAVIVAVLGASAYRAFTFTESPTFCGDVCHKVMEPEYAAYKRTAHSRVPCTTCHIGPGASWFVQSKLSGTRQVFATLLNTYPRPIPAPVKNLRPSRDTCENCHWREKATGLKVIVFKHFLPDEKNTLQQQALAFRVGTGGDEPTGVHWHIAAKVYYRTADPERQVMTWVGVEQSDGSTREFVNPSEADDPNRETRLMDCIDCHNRAGHEIRSPNALIDDALAKGRLDPSLPYLKREALRILYVNSDDPVVNLARAREKGGDFESLREFYQRNYPDIAQQKQASIERAIATLEDISKQVVFPWMDVSWKTYPQNNGHIGAEKQDMGCFRCHGTLISKATNQPIAGGIGWPGSCLTCHSTGKEAPTGTSEHAPEVAGGCGFCHFPVPLSDIGLGPTPSAPFVLPEGGS